ncbi:uncharacterized protein LOC128672698 [Plodia interpunctella]|uniref:uncharacterized protein LOC128672698 n=1 Tax=Plodia interpunctella TaxID=58824 RepID=UPI002367B818|nr:uncharacterized protein LOC128672698 [Plodia interpunctella]
MSGREQIGEKVPFEVAMDKTGFGLYNLLLTSLAGLVIISFGCIVYGSTIIVPSSACELETTPTQQGLLASAPIIGKSSGQYTISMTMLSESVPMAKRNLVVLLVTSIFLLAQGIMAVLAIPIIPLSFSYEMPVLGIYWNSWRTLMLVYCAPSLLCACWLFFMQESPKYALAKGDEAETLRILNVIYKLNNRKSSEEYQVKGIVAEGSSEKASTKDQVVPLFKVPLLKYTIIMTTLSVFHQITAFGIWLPTIANQYVRLLETGEGADLTICGIINTELEIVPDPDATPCALNVTSLLIVLVVGVMQSCFNLIISALVDRVGRRNTAMAITAFCGTCGILVNLVPGALASLLLFGLYLMAMMVLGLYTAISVALFPTHLRALAVSLTMTGGRVFSFASIQILNYLLINNCEVGFYVYASILVSSAIVASFLPDDRLLRKRLLQQQQQKQIENPVHEEASDKS